MLNYICYYKNAKGDICHLSFLARNKEDAAAQCFSASSFKPFRVTAEHADS